MLPWGATTADLESTTLQIEPGKGSIQSCLDDFMESFRLKNQLPPRIDLHLSPGRYFGDVCIRHDNVSLIGTTAINPNVDADDAMGKTATILGRVVVEDCVGACITNVCVLRDTNLCLFPVGLTVRNPRCTDNKGLYTECVLQSCVIVNCHVKAQNSSRLLLRNCSIDGSDTFGILSEFGADVFLCSGTVVQRCNIGLMSHKKDRDPATRHAEKMSKIHILDNSVDVRNNAETNELASGGGQIVRYVSILEDLLDTVDTATSIRTLFETMLAARAICPQGLDKPWYVSDFIKHATEMSLRVGSKTWTRELAQLFGLVLKHVSALKREENGTSLR